MENETIICHACDGSGWEFISCCGDDVLGTEYEDIGLCPTCFEHLGEREKCVECNGEGYIDPIEVLHNMACEQADRQNKQRQEA